MTRHVSRNRLQRDAQFCGAKTRLYTENLSFNGKNRENQFFCRENLGGPTGRIRESGMKTVAPKSFAA